MKNHKCKKILLIGAFLSFILWVVSINLSMPIYNEWGLIKGIHPLFYTSLLLITLIFIFLYFSEKYDKLIPVCILIIIIYLYYSYSLIETRIELTPYNTYLDFVKPIINTGMISPQKYWYQSWPLGLIFEAIFFEITSISPIKSFLFIPVLMKLLLVPIIFLISLLLLNDRKMALMSCFLFFTMSVVDLNNFIPSYISFIVWLATLLLFLLMQKGRNKFSFVVLFITLCLSLALHHFLYSLFFISFLIILKIYNVTRITKENVSLNCILILLTLVISWMIYSIWFMFESIVPQFVSTAFNLSFLTESGTQAVGSNSYMSIKTVRNIGLLLFCIFSAVGIYTGMWDKRSQKAVFYPIAIIVGVFIWFPAAPYNGEFLTRALLFSTLPLSVLCALSLSNQKMRKLFLVLFWIFLILAPFIHLVSVYGLKESKYVPESDIALSAYFNNKGEIQSKVIALPFGLILDFRGRFHRIDISKSLVGNPEYLSSNYAVKTKMSDTFAYYNLVQLGHIHDKPQDYELFFKNVGESSSFYKIYIASENSIIFMRSESDIENRFNSKL